MSTEERHRFEEACLQAIRALLAEGAALRSEMDGHGQRTLRSLSLERSDDDATIVAEVTDRDGSEITERYSVWNDDEPVVTPSDPQVAHQIALSIAIAIANI